jgi:hypothetical protein
MSEQQITVFRKANGPLSKKISLSKDGKIVADGAVCKMAAGTARRVCLNGVAALAKLIRAMPSDEALTLGRLRPDMPDECQVVLKKDLNDATPPNVIARTTDSLYFAERQPAYLLLDHDGKGMPGEVAERLRQRGEFWAAMTLVAPALADAARVIRRSTSAGLYHGDTGARLGGSTNQHVYIAVADGSDIKRALKALHQRLWLAGLGFYVVGRAGQLIDRSIIDWSVFGAERLAGVPRRGGAPPAGT